MTSNKPYLIRALYEWITDNGLTPYVLINTDAFGCRVPQEHVSDGRIVLNIAHDVVSDLVLGNAAIEFSARFSGVEKFIYAPIHAIAAIYAKENGQGMAFTEETTDAAAEGSDQVTSSTTVKGKPDLKIVK